MTPSSSSAAPPGAALIHKGASSASPVNWCNCRPAIVAPRGKARTDIDIVFDLAVRLGLGNQSWDGNIEAALSHHLAPSGLTPAMLAGRAPRHSSAARNTLPKYRERGFATPTGKIEIFSAQLQEIDEAPLPEFRAPTPHLHFPLALTSAKTPLYCHSQHRNLPRLRRLAPDPIAEMSPATADARGIGDGDWIVIATPRGRVRARARFNGTLGDGIVAAQHGWWQACPELGLPGYDPLDEVGANVNLAIGTQSVDPVSGAPRTAAILATSRSSERYCWRIDVTHRLTRTAGLLQPSWPRNPRGGDQGEAVLRRTTAFRGRSTKTRS